MGGMRQCSSCGRQFDESYQFCPFDATPLGTKCPACGKIWDSSFQFCPLDSTPLSVAAPPPQPAPAAPETEKEAPAAAPPPATPSPAPASLGAPQPAAFTFVEQVAAPAWKQILNRPVTYLFLLGLLATGYAVWYLNWKTSGPDLPLPTVSYTLLPNEGKTKGVPVAIKVNQLTVFMIDDPTDSPEGAGRAKKMVTTLEAAMQRLKNETEVKFQVETVEGQPTIIEVNQSTPEPARALASVTEADVTLAGETDATRVAGQWAVRLTDAVMVFIFGQAPRYSTGTEFGQALLAMYKAAAEQGKITKKSLDQA